MASLVVPKADILGIEIDYLQKLAVFALLYFSIDIAIAAWNSIPNIPWYWWPTRTCQLDIPDTIEDLLPSENKNKTERSGFKTLATFRTDFCLRNALHEYHNAPIAYAIALEEVGKEVFWTAYQKDASRCRALLAEDHGNRQRLYMADGSARMMFVLLILRHMFMLDQTLWLLGRASHVVKRYVEGPVRKVICLVGFATAPQISSTSNTVEWIAEFIKFRENVRDLCRHIGSELEENAPLWETVRNLKRYASEGKQKMSPLYRQIDTLKDRLERQKRIIAALQIRCTIENLVNEIPDKGKYADAPGAKWRKLWGDIVEDVKTNVQNPFCALLKDVRRYRAEDIKRAGSELYSAMSAEIHGFEGWKVDYEHFDLSTKIIARLLRPDRNRDVNWKEEINKYPFNLEEDGSSFKKASRKARLEPSKEWIESTDFCQECLSKIAKKTSRRLGVKTNQVEEEAPKDLLDRIDDKDLGLAALMS